MNLKHIVERVKEKLASTEISPKELQYHKELVEEISKDKQFEELRDHVALKVYSNLKKVHGKFLDFVKNNPIKGMTTNGEAWDKFYQSGYGSNASFVHKLMKDEGITIRL